MVYVEDMEDEDSSASLVVSNVSRAVIVGSSDEEDVRRGRSGNGFAEREGNSGENYNEEGVSSESSEEL
jgi:hypothetical protein